MKSLVLAAAALMLLAGCATLSLADPVEKWPGFDGLMPSNMDSGYITVDEQNDRRIFYIFVESYNDPDEDPLFIWLNGGPGCSGMFGFFTEHGPFLMNFTAQGHGLTLNPFAWANVANIIYIESPAGVGFSSSNVTSDYNTGDRRTALDSYNFLQGFLEKFPQYRKNDFWVAGESYGGHYVPELVYEIQNQNKKATPEKVINLKGLMAGNPWTAPNLEAFGVVENWWNRGIISEKYYLQIQENCDYEDITFWIIYNVSAGSSAAEMQRVLSRKLKNYEDYKAMYERETGRKLTKSRATCMNALHMTSQVEFGAVNILGVYLDVCNKGTVQLPDQFNPCHTSQMTTYLNLPEVQAALHVTAPMAYPEWQPCSPVVNYNFTDTVHSVLYIYEELMKTDMKVLVFSGDQDAIVPFTGTRKWLHALNRTIVHDTHEWFADTNGQQVGGWATEYDRFTFTTVRDAGHMVATAQPQRALKMFRDFIKNGKL
jgi:serine carboxypeptidase-like clade 2